MRPLLLFVMSCAALLAACASPVQRLPVLANDQNGAVYLLGPGDSLRISQCRRHNA